MDCKDIQRKLGLYLSGGLSEKDRLRVEAHVASCGRCREELRLYRESYDALDRIADVHPSEDFQMKLRSRLRPLRAAREGRRAQAQPAGAKKGHIRLRRAAAAAACVAIAFGLLFHFWPRPQTPTAGLTAEEEREILENLALLENLEMLEAAENGDMKMYAGEKYAAAEVLAESNIKASAITNILPTTDSPQVPGASRE